MVEENEEFEPRIRWAVDREHNSLKTHIAKLVKRHKNGQKPAEELEHYAGCQTTDWATGAGQQTTGEARPHTIPGLPGAVVIKANDGTHSLVWYDASSGQVVCL